MIIPKTIYLDTNLNCNLRCSHCDIHLWKNPASEISFAQRADLIRQVGSWDRRIKLAFSGGEPFLRRKELYALALVARESGVHLSINTNGSILKEDDFKRLPQSGIRAIILSIDHHLPEVHDQLRGVAGTYERVTEALRRLMAETKAQRARFSVLVSIVLGQHNLDCIPEMCARFEALGADALLFQPVQPNFGREVPARWWEETGLFPKEAKLVNRGLADLLRLKSGKRKIFQTEAQIEDMRRYFLQPEVLDSGHCSSMEDSLVIDMLGDVRLCFNMARLDFDPVGNITKKPLAEIWTDSRGIAEKMKGCSLECGAMLCHAR